MKTLKFQILTLALLMLVPGVAMAQEYIVSSLATEGSVTFEIEGINKGVITLPFKAVTETYEVQTNQIGVSVGTDADWCPTSSTPGSRTSSRTTTGRWWRKPLTRPSPRSTGTVSRKGRPSMPTSHPACRRSSASTTRSRAMRPSAWTRSARGSRRTLRNSRSR